jgi:hypothetical protein
MFRLGYAHEGRTSIAPPDRLRRWRNRGNGDLARTFAGSPVCARSEIFVFYGRRGLREVGYDNERGKGDHRHFRDVETAYMFTSVEQLMVDFWADVRSLRGRK